MEISSKLESVPVLFLSGERLESLNLILVGCLVALAGAGPAQMPNFGFGGYFAGRLLFFGNQQYYSYITMDIEKRN